jgi:YidC/Oxa1 family membrane protein insertase|tara:strand:+ start:18834 stop:19766 length:933 start_codon:yes stop_codon:yes gene_type:complete
MKPMINSLSLLYDLLGDNLGLAIISFTVLIRFVLIPLTVRQTKQMKKMQELQPQLQAIQKKHKNKTPQTKQKVQQETMALYKQAGVNPVGCLGPLIIQMPIWIGLYRAILKSAPSSPEGFVDLSKYFYSWNFSISKVPFNSNFLGIDLVDFVQFAPTPWQFALPVIVGSSMFIQQKFTTSPSTDPRQQQTQQMMLWMMPIMFGIFTWQFPAGLAVYIFFSNLMGIIIQYFVGGKQPLMLFGKLYFGTDQSREEYLEKLNNQKLSKETQIEETNNNKEDSNESKDIQRENSRRGNRRSLKNSKKRPRKPRN